MKKLCAVCAAFILMAGLVGTAAGVEESSGGSVTISYAALDNMVKDGNLTYIQAKGNVLSAEAQLTALGEQLSYANDFEAANKKLSDQRTTVAEQKEALETTLAQQQWQAQNLFLNDYILRAKMEQQSKTLETLQSQLASAEKKVAAGALAKSSLKSIETQITAQKKTIIQAKADIDSNLKNLLLTLGLPEKTSVKLGSLPSTDISAIPKRNMDDDLEKYLANVSSVVSQRKKVETAKNTYKDSETTVNRIALENAELQLEKAIKDATAAFPTQFESLQEKYTSWGELESTIKDKKAELAELQKKLNAGSVSAKTVNDKKAEIEQAQQNQATGKIELYQAMRRYENTLQGW